MKSKLKTKNNSVVKLGHDYIVAKIKEDAAFEMLQNFKAIKNFKNKNNRLGRGV